jgi:hypothetical protein
LLVCSRADAAARVHAALREHIASDPEFRTRCLEAARRSLQMRRRCRPRPGTEQELAAVLQDAARLEAELEQSISA